MIKLRYENFWLRNSILLAACALLAFIDFIVWPDPQELPFYWVLMQLIALYLITLLHNVAVIRNFFLKKKLKSVVLLSIGYVTLIAWVINQFSIRYLPQESAPFWSDWVSMVIVILLSSGFYLGHHWILENLIDTKKRMLITETELAQLKQQMNPHFLLNALNNLYGVSLASPQKVPEKILELSDLLTYQIETSKKEWVSLRQEMDFASKYLRYMEWKTNGMKVKIEIKGKIKDYKITPMIFLPLLENAGKYASETSEPVVQIEWIFGSRDLQVTVTNNFSPGHSKIKSTKIGIENLKRRLELYHPDHELTLYKENNQFRSQLELWNLDTAA
jgi:sensor histidine kinase YesM